jgi:flagellar basal-body rod protein FlgG
MAVTALHSSASGLSALSTNLDVIANNLANVNTEGFKASRTNFQDLLYVEKSQPGVENRNGDQRPTGLYVGLGVKVSGTQVDFRQGSPITTSRELDLMIGGSGFFQVQVENDRAPGGVAYTRAGNFTLNADGEIVLATDQGRRLEPNIVVPNNAEGIQVMESGEVFARIAGEQDPQQIGQIDLSAAPSSKESSKAPTSTPRPNSSSSSATSAPSR